MRSCSLRSGRRSSVTARRSSCLALDTSAQPGSWTIPGARRFERRWRQARLFSASASACSGCSREATRRTGLPGLGALRGRCFRLPPPVKVPHVGWNALEIVRPVAAPRWCSAWNAGVLHAFLRRAAERRHRGERDARRDVRGGSSAGTRVRRAVSSGEIRRRGPADPAQLRIDDTTCCPNASSRALTCATARSSRGSTSRGSGAQAIRRSSPPATTSRASTSS